MLSVILNWFFVNMTGSLTKLLCWLSQFISYYIYVYFLFVFTIYFLIIPIWIIIKGTATRENASNNPWACCLQALTRECNPGFTFFQYSVKSFGVFSKFNSHTVKPVRISVPNSTQILHATCLLRIQTKCDLHHPFLSNSTQRLVDGSI